MRNRKSLLIVAIGLCLLLAVLFGYLRWRSSDVLALREQVLLLTPVDASAVIFIDLAEVRSSPFLAQLFAWAPHPAPDSDYAQFVQGTGFDYERDLDRVAIAISREGSSSRVVAAAEGRF